MEQIVDIQELVLKNAIPEDAASTPPFPGTNGASTPMTTMRRSAR
ncbi:unnamed protein product [Staurois parvus]|uniref:Uncharacterized protein n=1 Tax=Staurois parvus TaxID=386267 RepID=A0ABN9BX95_9NEOB|nr:unnamed protein product [Staurois parvus]